MSSLWDIVILSSLTCALLAPLAHALATLRGMKGKRLYPILRVRTRRPGRVTLLAGLATGRNGHRG